MPKVRGVRERRPQPTSAEIVANADRIRKGWSDHLDAEDELRILLGVPRAVPAKEPPARPLPIAIVRLPRLSWWARIRRRAISTLVWMCRE